MVVEAKRVEFVQAGVAGVGPVEAVVDLDAGARAAEPGAVRAGPGEGDALDGGGAAAEVGDGGDVDAAGDDELEDGVAEEVAGDGDGDGSDAGDLAEFVAGDPAAVQGGEVDPEQGQVARIGPPPSAG
jgi:hypothetical protein